MTPDLDAIEGRDPVEVMREDIQTVWNYGINACSRECQGDDGSAVRHNEPCGKGAFCRVLAALEQLIKERGMTKLAMEVDRRNYLELEADLSALREQLTATKAERDALAKGIADAAEEAGIFSGEWPLTGPHLLLLAGDLARSSTALREQLTGLVERLRGKSVNAGKAMVDGVFDEDSVLAERMQGSCIAHSQDADELDALLHPKGSTE